MKVHSYIYKYAAFIVGYMDILIQASICDAVFDTKCLNMKTIVKCKANSGASFS